MADNRVFTDAGPVAPVLAFDDGAYISPATISNAEMAFRFEITEAAAQRLYGDQPGRRFVPNHEIDKETNMLAYKLGYDQNDPNGLAGWLAKHGLKMSDLVELKNIMAGGEQGQGATPQPQKSPVRPAYGAAPKSAVPPPPGGGAWSGEPADDYEMPGAEDDPNPFRSMPQSGGGMVPGPDMEKLARDPRVACDSYGRPYSLAPAFPRRPPCTDKELWDHIDKMRVLPG